MEDVEAAAATQPLLTVPEINESKPTNAVGKLKQRIRILLYMVFVLAGQAAAVLLGRQYYNKGGKSKWLATLVQLAGFPLLISFFFSSPLRNDSNLTNDDSNTQPPRAMALAGVYASLGLLVAAHCFLDSVGLMYLPVSTYSLICASELGFSALFSYLLNSEKFTPFVVNSLVLLTLSSTELILTGESSNPDRISKGKYIIGFICSVAASAVFGLGLSLSQFLFRKVLKKQNFDAVMSVVIFQSLVATALVLIGFFASGDWRHLEQEMNSCKSGKFSYLMTLISGAISWQIFTIGSVGLIFEVSSLFSNAISVLGLPVVPVLAVVFFGDKMDGVKVMAMILAIWGFLSYMYQHYLDECEESRNQMTKSNDDA